MSLVHPQPAALEHRTVSSHWHVSISTMDYEGQKLAELIFYWIILAFGGVGWVIGYIQQDFTVVFQVWLVGVVLSVIVRLLGFRKDYDYDYLTKLLLFIWDQLCVPDWPFYNRHPIKWLESIPDRREHGKSS
jgi:signal peptidase complex subunit 1